MPGTETLYFSTGGIVNGTTFDPQTFKRAAFVDPGKTFQHFVNPAHTNCFACNSRAMLVRPIEVTARYTLMEATTRLATGEFVIVPQCWLIYPRTHVTTLFDLPGDWTSCVQSAVRTLGLEPPFCTSENWGRAAGQTVPHAHTWVVGRGFGEEGLVCEGVGLATIIMRLKQYGIILP